MKKNQKKTLIIEFDLPFTGEWYDGDSWDDGVPFVSGSITCWAALAKVKFDDDCEWPEVLLAFLCELERKLCTKNVETSNSVLEIQSKIIDGVNEHKLNYDKRVFPTKSARVEFECNDEGLIDAVVLDAKFMSKKDYEASMP